MKKLLILIAALTASVALAADGPITGFSALGNNLASGDWFTVVDISDTSASVNGTNKKILTSDVGLYYISDTAYSSAFNAVTDKGVSKNAIYDYLHLGDADDDGKIDVLDLAAAGFPALDSAGALVASRSIAEGAAIDVTNGTGAAGNPTVAFDSTEVEATTWGAGGNASNVWTFNLSGTDPVVTLSSGVVNVSTGTLQQGGVDVATISGTQTFTNKTLTSPIIGGAADAGGATSFEIPNSDDPDVTVAGQISWDTDGWLRAYDGTNQVAVGRKIETIQATVVSPNDLADSERDAFWIWSNESGMSFVVTGWKAWSDTDDTTLNIEEINADGTSNTTIDAVEIATNGTNLFSGSDTTITAATVEDGHIIQLDFDDTDTPGQVKITIYGYYAADVN